MGHYTQGDAIDLAGQTAIAAGAGNDFIDLRSATHPDQRGYSVNGPAQNDVAATGEDFAALDIVLNFAAGARETQSQV